MAETEFMANDSSEVEIREINPTGNLESEDRSHCNLGLEGKVRH